MRIKSVKWRSHYGEELSFCKKYPLYIEKIDTFGVSGRFVTGSVLGSPGQITSDFEDGAKTIPAEFAFWNKKHDTQILKKIERVFTPLKPGLLTVWDEDGMMYRIEAYPNAMPVFQRSGKAVLKWSVNFTADYPYWKKGYRMKEYTVESAYTDIFNPCPIELPIEITFPASQSAATFRNETSGTSFRVTEFDRAFTVNTLDFSVRDESGNNVNQVLYASDDIGDVKLLPGQNRIWCLQNGVKIRFWELTGGIM